LTIFLKEHPNAIGLFGGDLLSPSVESRWTKGQHMIDGLNYISQSLKGRFVAVPGNHEFDFGLPDFLKALKKSRFKWVLANTEADAQTKKSLPPYVVLNQKGVKTLVYGLTLQETGTAKSSDFKITAPFANAHKELIELRKQIRPDVTILLAHLGEHTYEDISQLPIDVAVVGHEHDKKMVVKNGVTIVRADADLETFGALHLQLKKRLPFWRRMMNLMHDTVHDRLPPSQVQQVENNFIPVYPDGESDSGLLNTIDPVVIKKSNALQESLFQLNAPLDTRCSKIRGAESSVGNLLADASRIAWNDAHPQKPVDIALIHSGNIRGDKIIPPKEEGFTLRNLYEILPFDNPAYHIEMSGEMIQSILEHSLAHIVEGDVVLDKHSGSFMNFSGLRVKADLTRPYGQRISEIKTTNEDPIDPKKSYRVLIDSYIARKNAGFPMLYGYTEQNPSKVWKDTQINSDYIKAYFLKQKEKGATINPSIDGRWDITRSSK